MKKITERDIRTILKCAEKIDKIATKYGITGNLAQVYLEVLKQSRKHLNFEDVERIVKRT